MKSGYPVIGATVLDKLKKSYAKYNEQATAELERQVTEVIRRREEKGGARIEDVFAKASTSSSRTVSKSELEKLLKHSYEGISQKEVDAVVGALAVTKSGDVALVELQSFLRKYSGSRSVSVGDECSLPLNWR